MRNSLSSLFIASALAAPAFGGIVASDNFNAANAPDLAGATTGSGFSDAWTRSSAASSSVWTLNSNRAVYDGGISDSTNYTRTLAAPVTVTVGSTITVTYDFIIGGGSGDGNSGRGLGIRLKSGTSGVLTIGKAANRPVNLYPGTMAIGDTATAALSSTAVSGNTVPLNTTYQLVTTLTFDGTNTNVTLLNVTNSQSTSTSIPGQVTFDAIELAGYHASTTSNGVDNLTVDVSVVADPKLLVASEFDFVNIGGFQLLSIPVSNTGKSNPLAITSVNVTGTHAAAFEVDVSSFAAPIASGGNGTLLVDFIPTGGFTHTATLTINSNDTAEPAQVVKLTVLVRDPEVGINFDLSSVDFGQQAYPGSTLSEAFEIQNNGEFNDLVVSSITFTGPGASAYSVSAIPAPIAPNNLGSFNVTFNPGTGDGSFQAVMQIATNDPVVPLLQIPVRALVALQTPDDALVSRFTFDNEGLPFDDSGPFGNHGTAVGDALRTTTARDGAGALLLDGTGDYLNVRGAAGYSTLADDGDGFSVTAWVRTGTLTAAAGVFGVNSASNGWLAGLNAGGIMRASAPLVWNVTAPSAVASSGSWHHLAWVFRQRASAGGISPGRVDFYVDGVPAQAVVTPQQGLLPTTSDFLIGSLTTGGGAFTGSLDDLRIYDRELGDTNVAALYASYPSLPGGFASWAEVRITDASQRNANDDPDSDGIVNLLEYALGYNPETPGTLPTLSSGSITWPKGAEASADASLTYQIKTSINLSDWDPATPATNTGSEISYILPTGQPRQFVRLEVSMVP
jgi:hypothetical protein